MKTPEKLFEISKEFSYIHNMKSLSEFIYKNQNTNPNRFDENFIPNLYENDEFYWHLVLDFSKRYINEAYSFVQEICALSPKIIKKIQNNLDKSLIEFTKLKASFFRELEIEIINKKDLSIVVNGDADIDKSTKENLYITLELNKNDYDKGELKDTIEHELVHLYQNFHHLKNNKSLRQTLDKRFYDNYTDIENLSDPKDQLKLIIYLFDPDECTEKIQGMLAKIDGRKLTNPRKVFDIVSKEAYYKNMKYYYDNVDDLENTIPGLANYYRDIFPKWKSLTRDQIISKLQKYIKKNWKSFQIKLSKACVGKCERRIK